jgi:bifunctional N-acetylglucosamine-1-phosphate-uridyltransferase/glucosamine-1-phosphate-acetyltransferase GlmU-like protein
MLTETTVGKGAVVEASVCVRATIGDGARVGPYSVLEAGSEVAAGARVPPHSVLGGPGG